MSYQEPQLWAGDNHGLLHVFVNRNGCLQLIRVCWSSCPCLFLPLGLLPTPEPLVVWGRVGLGRASPECFLIPFPQSFDVGHSFPITGIQYSVGALYTTSTDRSIRVRLLPSPCPSPTSHQPGAYLLTLAHCPSPGARAHRPTKDHLHPKVRQYAQ